MIGPVEAQTTKVLLVDKNATGTPVDGSTWSRAYRNLQDALVAAPVAGFNRTQIWVKAGVYRPDQGGGYMPGDRAARFALEDNVEIYGGFAGTEDPATFNPQQPGARDFVANQTILSGDLQSNDDPNSDPEEFGDDSSRSDNSYHVFRTGTVNDGVTSSAVLDGFTITGGQASTLGEGHVDAGGGMLNISSTPTVRHCLFTRNWAAREGGGVSNRKDANGLYSNCTFLQNGSGEDGGGIALDCEMDCVRV